MMMVGIFMGLRSLRINRLPQTHFHHLSLPSLLWCPTPGKDASLSGWQRGLFWTLNCLLNHFLIPRTWCLMRAIDGCLSDLYNLIKASALFDAWIWFNHLKNLTFITLHFNPVVFSLSNQIYSNSLKKTQYFECLHIPALF